MPALVWESSRSGVRFASGGAKPPKGLGQQRFVVSQSDVLIIGLGQVVQSRIERHDVPALRI